MASGVRVYVTNAAGHDYQKAEQYGELRYIIKGYISFQSLDRLKYDIASKLQDTRGEDWMCISGTSIINVLCAIIWFQMHSCINILVWDKKFEIYREIRINQHNLLELFAQL